MSIEYIAVCGETNGVAQQKRVTSEKTPERDVANDIQRSVLLALVVVLAPFFIASDV